MSKTRYLVALVAVLLATGTLSARADTIEQMLIAAGFNPEPANAAADLQTLPPREVVERAPQTATGAPPAYVYADPDGCGCVYVGGPVQYEKYQQLSAQAGRVVGD